MYSNSEKNIRSRSITSSSYENFDSEELVRAWTGSQQSSSKISGNLKRWRWLVYISIFAIVMYLINAYSIKAKIKYKSRLPKNADLTIVMNTFKRHDLMLEAIEHYSSCTLVKHIYVTWSEKKPPPARITSLFKQPNQTPKVVFNIQKEDNLNTRFKPLSGPHSDAIFSVDDDMRVPCSDLETAYEVWRSSPFSLVGFMPRIHLRRGGKWEYRCWWRVWWHGEYSIILTKASILHHHYFDLYTNEMPKEVLKLVKDSRNCEDIAMQFLISNHTGLPPIYVKGNLEDKGVLNGISTKGNVTKAGHMHKRSNCLTDLEKIYKKMPLVKSHFIVDSAKNGWTNSPSTVWEYISSDLWKF